jgi:hypothetical protein
MALTLRTVPRCLDSIITIMAQKGAIPEVICECHAAVRTFEGLAAIRTKDKIGKPSSIEEEETLFFVFDIFLECNP